MAVGHTKCDADGAFGLIKRKWRHSNTYTMDQFEKVVNGASKSLVYRELPEEKWRHYRKYYDQFLKKQGVRGISDCQRFVINDRNPLRVLLFKSAASVDGEQAFPFDVDIPLGVISGVQPPLNPQHRSIDAFRMVPYGLHPDRVKLLKKMIVSPFCPASPRESIA